MARGFEEDNHNLDKESPTCSKDSFRVINAIVVQKQWKLNTTDIKTAFLQGEELDIWRGLSVPTKRSKNKQDMEV